MEEPLAAKIALEGWLPTGSSGVEGCDVLHHALLTAFAEQWPDQVPSWLPRLVAATAAIRAAEPGRFFKVRRLAVVYLAERLTA